MFFLWLIFTLIAAIYFIQNRLAQFDPELNLNGNSRYSLISQIRELELLKETDLSNTIIHFTSNDCSCTQYSVDHKLSIDKIAKRDGFKVININLSQDLHTIIPSTPAILIVDKQQELLYFGPYSVGLACSESNGYVETVLKNYAKGYHSNLIISDVKGCYCNL